METYTFLRAFADSWMLLAMTLFFIGMVFWTFRPSARAAHDDSAQIPLRNDAPRDEVKPEAATPEQGGRS